MSKPIFKPVVLASSSPRRKELLERAFIACRILIPEIDEAPRPKEHPFKMVQRLAFQKAEAIASQVGDEIVLAADTTVVNFKNKNLGKPGSRAEAIRMLKSLAGKPHFVFTAYAILLVRQGKIQKKIIRGVRTRVEMRKLSRLEIEAYVDCGESMDKAGAYAAQGFGMTLIQKIVGSYTNVVGLPISEVIEDLKKLGWK